MKFILPFLVFSSSLYAATTVKCYERTRFDTFEMTTLVKKTRLSTRYEYYRHGELLEKGRLKKEVDGEGEEYALCLSNKGDADWFSFCIDDAVVSVESPYGSLIQMYGIREYDLGIELLCEEKILKLLHGK